MGAVRIKLNSAGVQALLRDKHIQADLEQRAHAIAVMADDLAGAPDGHKVDTFEGKNRVRVTVTTDTTEARLGEATVRSLTTALASNSSGLKRDSLGRLRSADGRFVSRGG